MGAAASVSGDAAAAAAASPMDDVKKALVSEVGEVIYCFLRAVYL